MEVAVGSALGIWQEHNLDAYLAERFAPAVSFFGVADGFGQSGQAGQDASSAQMALSLVRDFLRRKFRSGAMSGRHASPANLRRILVGAFAYANSRLFALSGSHDDFVGGGTSMTGVLVVGHHAFVAHVGDGRAYVQRYGRLEALTVDDSLTMESVPTSGVALSARARPRNLLWRTLGTQPKLEATIAHVELLEDDQLVLCTDGIHRCVQVEEIVDTLSDYERASDAVGRLLFVSKSRGNVDNATILIGRRLLASVSRPQVDRADSERTRGIVIIAALLVAALLSLIFFAH